MTITINSTVTALACAILVSACGPQENGSGPASESAETHAGENHGEGGEETGHADAPAGADLVALSPKEASQYGISTSQAERRGLPGEKEIPAKIHFDANKLANVTPRIGGVVHSLDATEGDDVGAGEALAVLDSRKLATLKADYLGALAAERLAETTFTREDQLLEQGVTSEAEYAAAREALATARAQRESAETKLHSVGVSHAALAGIENTPDGALGRYVITAPIAGTMIERRISLGQSVPAGGDPVFVVADDSTVWADIDIYREALDEVKKAAPVTFHNDAGEQIARGEIAFVTPQLQEGSRTATARVILDNADGAVRPGMFLTARVGGMEGGDAVAVPTEAVQTYEGGSVVFVPVQDGFAPRPVTTGEESGGWVEILSGLQAGEDYAAEGAFTLKAQLEKGGFDSGHAH